MTFPDFYTCLKCIHVTAAIIFIGGVVATALVLDMLAGSQAEARNYAARMKRWDSILVIPAMLTVWAFGIALAVDGGWFRSGWLDAKLAFVLIVSALHGMQSGRLRRIVSGLAPTAWHGLLPALACAAAIVFLAVAKP